VTEPISALVGGARAHDAFVLRSVLEAPWALAVRDEAPLTVLTAVRGEAWVLAGPGEPRRVGPGDVALVRGPDPYVVADRPATRPQVVIHPGQRCTTLEGESRAMVGTRTWGTGGPGGTVLLTGTYQRRSEVSERLLSSLPVLAVLEADASVAPVVDLLATEVGRDEPGQEAVLDRLLDLLAIAALRAWFALRHTAAPGWYRARTDPVVGPALDLLQERPAEPWTVAALARATCVSRATLARRFTELTGEPPIRYLTRLRLDLAADLLRHGNGGLAAVAAEVGYASPFALSTAFTRVRGQSPAAFRREAAGQVQG